MHLLNATSLYVNPTWRTELGLDDLSESRKKDELFQRVIHLNLSWKTAGADRALGTLEFWVVQPGVLGKPRSEELV